jgi:hypothetical protein
MQEDVFGDAYILHELSERAIVRLDMREDIGTFDAFSNCAPSAWLLAIAALLLGPDEAIDLKGLYLFIWLRQFHLIKHDYRNQNIKQYHPKLYALRDQSRQYHIKWL